MRLTRAMIVACALLFTLPAMAEPPETTEDAPVEEGSLGTRPNVPLLVSGSIIGGLSYGVPFAIGLTYFALVWPFQAAFGNPNPPKTILYMMVPLVGPILAAQTDFSDDNPDLKTMFYVDAGLQFVGAGLIVSSFVFRQKVRPRSAWHLGPGPGGSAGVSLHVEF